MAISMDMLGKAMLWFFFSVMCATNVIGVKIDGVDLGDLSNPDDVTLPAELKVLCEELHYNIKKPLEDLCIPLEKKLWSYKGRSNGPCLWGLIYPNCYGSKQSPINIVTSLAASNKRPISLNMKNYEKQVTKATVDNNGYHVNVRPHDDIERTIEVEGTTYKLVEIHFHWNKDITMGSSHAIDGQRFAFEAHFVHRNAKNEVAIMGVLYTTADGVPNYGFKPLITILKKIEYAGQNTELKLPLNLASLLPEKTDEFYRYEGALAFPPCNEKAVHWSIFSHTSHIGKNQLSTFFDLYAVSKKQAHGNVACKLDRTVRPLQPLNGRTVALGTA